MNSIMDVVNPFEWGGIWVQLKCSVWRVHYNFRCSVVIGNVRFPCVGILILSSPTCENIVIETALVNIHLMCVLIVHVLTSLMCTVCFW